MNFHVKEGKHYAFSSSKAIAQEQGPLLLSLHKGKRGHDFGLKSLRDRRGEVYDVALCTVSGLQPGSFHFVALLPVPALNIQK